MTIQQAQDILYSMTETDSLRKHAYTVSVVMKALARKFGEDEEQFAVTGLLHDADYEKYPGRHPEVIVHKLNEMGETIIAYAIAGHYTIWNVPRKSLLDKSIVAADELTGFIVAASLVRPTGLEGMDSKSVMKKLKTSTFAAKVDREEVYRGAQLIDMELTDLINFIISVLRENKAELGLN